MAEPRGFDKLKAALERIRAAVRESLGPKEQLKFLNYIDTIQSEIAKGNLSPEGLNGPILRAKAGTRKVLRDDPIGMVKVLNGFETLEEEIMRAIAENS